MEWNSQNVIWGRDFLRSVVTALKTNPAAALIATAFLRLGTDPGLTIGPDTTLAQLEAQEADFQGYTAGGVAYSMSNPVNIGITAVAGVQNAIFIASGGAPLTQNEICNWWIDNSTIMVCGENIPEGSRPQFANNGDFLDLLAALPIMFRQSAA